MSPLKNGDFRASHVIVYRRVSSNHKLWHPKQDHLTWLPEKKLHLFPPWPEKLVGQDDGFVVFITMVIVFVPVGDRVAGPPPNGRTLWLINRGPILTTYKSWDDPLSSTRHSFAEACSCFCPRHPKTWSFLGSGKTQTQTAIRTSGSKPAHWVLVSKNTVVERVWTFNV